MIENNKKYFAIKNIKDNNYLDYAEKRKKLFKNGYTYYTVSTPFPTIRTKESIIDFKKWIKNTPNEKDYKIVTFIEEAKKKWKEKYKC